MLLYVMRRLVLIVPQTLAVGIGVFLLLRVLPVDPVSKFVGLYASKEAYALAQRKLGLDAPIPSQLGTYLSGLASGNLGVSWTTQVPIASEIAVRFPVTIQLTTLTFLVAIGIAVPVGLTVAARPGGRMDKVVTTYSLFAGSQPEFWWGLMFIFVLYFKLRWFPAPLGLTSIGTPAVHPMTNFILIDSLLGGKIETFWDALHHLGLPVITLAFVLTGPIMKMVRQTAAEVLSSDWVVCSRACGLRHNVIQRQVLRVSVAPALTLCGILFGYMLGGAVIIEYIFSLDGLGLYALTRTLASDFPAIQGAVLVMTTFALVVYVSMDLLHALLDPRIRYQSGRRG